MTWGAPIWIYLESDNNYRRANMSQDQPENYLVKRRDRHVKDCH